MPGRSYLHRYGDHPEQVADLVLPDGADPEAPQRCVVLIHGGLWREHFRRDLMAPLAEDLAARGRATWNVEYRRLDCGGGWPQTVDDVRAAVDHLRGLGHEPSAAVGHSAGGHLALLLADRVPAVVGQAAITDIELGIELRLGDDGTVVGRFAEGAPLDELSPIRRAPLRVPVLLVHGTADGDVPAVFSERFAARGGDVTLRLRDGEGHFEHLDPRSGAWEDVVAWLPT
jgi:acetyl esterase/lipase